MKLSRMSLLNLQKHNMWALARYKISGSYVDFVAWESVWSAMKRKEKEISFLHNA